ncbi:MAG: heme A synthase [Gammaproteobacteria bacterium]
MNRKIALLPTLAYIATFLALFVVALGAYTRATNAGLGCPDWPGCYNQLTAPHTATQIDQAKQTFHTNALHVKKAWTEMIHRYVAGTLSVLILILVIGYFRQYPFVCASLIAVIIFQILLGMWTVTLKLMPIVVLGHLLGGLTTLILLWLLALKSRPIFITSFSKILKPFAMISLIILALQIILGGWVSTNYAALICREFPYCSMHQFFPLFDLKQAFNLFHQVGEISPGALMTIHMIHRTWAVVVAVFLSLFGFMLIKKSNEKLLHRLAYLLFLFLIIQITFGILNVVWLLPIGTAVAHNAVAALLLMTLVALNYLLFHESK